MLDEKGMYLAAGSRLMAYPALDGDDVVFTSFFTSFPTSADDDAAAFFLSFSSIFSLF